jgi:hypothetical protein
MNHKSLVERFSLVKQTWELLLPAIPQPPQETFVLWIGTYQDNIIERALFNASRKFKNNQSVEPERVYRSVSAELRDLQRFWKPRPVVTLPRVNPDDKAAL